MPTRPGRRAPIGLRALLAAGLATGRLPGRLRPAVRAALNGVALGLLSDAALEALDEHYYDLDDTYRTREWNQRGLFAWEREAFETHLDGCRSVLVVACGGGRELLALLDAGFEATGAEPHPALADYAQQLLAEHGHVGRVMRSRRDEVPAGPPSDAIVIGWGAYSLVHGCARRIAMLGQARRRLVPGGPLVLSCFHREADTRELRWTRELACALRRSRRGIPVELGDTLAPNRVHVFTSGRLQGELGAAGFELTEHRVVAPAGEGTDYACVVAR